MTTPEGAQARRALALRLRAVADILLDDVPEPVSDQAEDAARLLSALATGAIANPVNERIWLLLCGISATYPTRDEVDEARRTIELSTPESASIYLLDSGLENAKLSGEQHPAVQVVTGAVLVDVDFTARHDLHTGIQRVVRQTLPHWNKERSIMPVAWTRGRGTLRLLEPTETARIYEWFDDRDKHVGLAGLKASAAGVATPGEPEPPGRLIIPWKCVIALPEVPPVDAATRIAALGACSNNKVVLIGYDTIPLVSADTVPIDEPGKFMPYLSAIKFADRIAAISDTAAEEFRSFTSMLAAQGLPGPVVTSVRLPADVGAEHPAVPTGSGPTPSGPPGVVVVGSHDPRKNHLAVLHAAELLWQEGLDFTLTFIGGGGSNLEFYHRVEVLQFRGRKVDIRLSVPENELQRAVAEARFTLFPSIHEGYGLPVAESMALGTPVITTEYGSTAEIAAGGGALTVDPRDDVAIADAMRLLLTSDTELAHLRSEIHERAERSWQTYADELWVALVEPVLADLARPGVPAGH